MKKIFLSVPLIFLLTGCLLPAGDPPDGKIVSNPAQQNTLCAATPAEAVEAVIPELTAALLSECPGAAVSIDADSSLRSHAQYALTECGKLTGNTAASRGVCQLQLRAKNKTWQWKLFHHSREVWNKTVQFR